MRGLARDRDAPADSRHRAAFDGQAIPTALASSSGRLIDANRAFLRAARVSAAAARGRPLAEVAWWARSAAERARLRKAIVRARGGELVRFDAEISGSRAPASLEIAVQPIAHEGRRLILLQARDAAATAALARRLETTIAHYQTILASTLDPVITIDGRGRMLYASDSTERVFGWTPKELIGENVSMIMPEPHRSAHDGYLARYRRTGATNILGRTREFEGVRRDGTRFPLELSVSRVDVPGERECWFTGIIHDIDERKNAERQVRLLQTLTLAISEAASLDQALQVSLRIVCRTAGWAGGEAWLPTAEGRLLRCVTWRAADAETARATLAPQVELQLAPGEELVGRAWRAGRPLWSESAARGRKRARSGARRGASKLALPILAASEPVAVLAFFLEGGVAADKPWIELASAALAPLGTVILRRRAEDELARHHAELERIIEQRTAELARSHDTLRLSERLASIGTLAAGLGHDMNNVLLPVRCHLDALEAGELSASLREPLRAVRKSMQYLQQLTDGLHLLALDPERPDETGATTELGAWWERVGTLLRNAASSKVDFQVDMQAGLPAVAAPPHRLTQALLNLVVNANEAVAGKGSIRVRARVSDDRRAVRLSVADDGCGMSDEVRRHALEPFFTTKTRGLGTGLGLSLAHGVAQAAGGRIEIESAPGKGTEVTLILPIAARASGSRKRTATLATVRSGDPRLVALWTAMLGAAGFRVALARGTDERIDPATRLLALDASDANLERARAYRAGRRGRELVAFGVGSPAWTECGATLIDPPADFARIRQVIDEISARAARRRGRNAR